MPPKSSRKPLNALQRKQLKRKQDLIHKATVKSQYYKTLNKQDDDTPDYVKDIFGAQEKTIDKDGNVVELENFLMKKSLMNPKKAIKKAIKTRAEKTNVNNV
ncbi:unnamed protein product [Rhizopus stolonifer]